MGTQQNLLWKKREPNKVWTTKFARDCCTKPKCLEQSTIWIFFLDWMVCALDGLCIVHWMVCAFECIGWFVQLRPWTIDPWRDVSGSFVRFDPWCDRSHHLYILLESSWRSPISRKNHLWGHWAWRRRNDAAVLLALLFVLSSSSSPPRHIASPWARHINVAMNNEGEDVWGFELSQFLTCQCFGLPFLECLGNPFDEVVYSWRGSWL